MGGGDEVELHVCATAGEAGEDGESRASAPSAVTTGL